MDYQFFNEKFRIIRKKMNKSSIFSIFIILFFALSAVVPLYAQSRPQPINSNEIKDYICIVNRHLHPNMERYLSTIISALIDDADEAKDQLARKYEYYKRGGSGSGFVYLDRAGNNYILTNYHVIVGAYRLSATFEFESGVKRTFSNLSVVGVDEAADLAILGFPAGEKPFRKGIPLYGTQVRDDTVVRAAGYPGIPDKPTWNITRGTVSNRQSWPDGREYWFIQHTAAINPGNSGGPLLVEDRRSPLRYSVAGMNTFQLRGITDAFYAIPTERISSFINGNFQQQSDDETSLENRLTAFIGLLGKSISSNVYVFESLSSYLSSTMINANPLSIVPRILEIDSTNQKIKELKNEVQESPINGVPWAVAFSQIEMPIFERSRNRLAQRQEQPEVIYRNTNNMGGYTIRFLICGYPYRTEWVKEYGTWKLDEFIEDDGEYNDYQDLATQHPLNKKVIYSLSSGLDFEWYTLEIPRAGRLTVRTEGNIDPQLLLCTDPTNKQTIERTKLGEHDDISASNLNAIVNANVQAGTVYVLVQNAGTSTGEYILFAGLNGSIDNIPYTTNTASSTANTSTYNGPPITIVNNTGSDVWIVYISDSASEEWGADRLPIEESPLRNGGSVSLQLPYPINQVNKYDIRLTTIISEDFRKMNVTVTANSRIVFTASDKFTN